MFKSIRVKLFIILLVLVIAFEAIFLFINSNYLDDIFISSNKKQMYKLYEEFLEKSTTEESVEELISYISQNKGVMLTIIDNGKVPLSSSFDFGRKKIFRIPRHVQMLINVLEKEKDKDTLFAVSSSDQIQNKAITFIGKLQKDKYLVIEKPLSVVVESSKIAERFTIISGIITLVIGSIIIFFLSGTITKPIIKINDTALAIAKQDFSKKIDYSGDDELGTLADSINLISSELDGALSELKEANSKLREDIEKERKLEKMRRRFVSSVSHELKTPISMIQGYADGLKFNIAKDPDDVNYYCNVIIDESKKMSRLIKDLLDLSSYESGTFTIEKKEFNLSNLVEEVVEKYRNELDKRNINFILEIQENSNIIADKLRIEQVILNFINNAQRHVNDNGNIVVTLKNLDKYIYLSVYNTGDNINKSEIDNIWTSFYKVRSKKSKPNEGTGLGLAIVRAIIELHKGKYGVNNLDDGVEFWVKIPKLN